MDGTSEKYPACPDRNTAAAFRWFYEPLDATAYLKVRKTRRPSAEALLAALLASERALDR